METDPDAKCRAAWPAMLREVPLDLGGGSDGLVCVNEYCEERIALGRDLHPLVGSERGSDDPLVLGVRARIPVTELHQEPGASLDVTETEREPSARTGHSRSMLAGPCDRAR